MKFKAGDKVRVRIDLKEGGVYGNNIFIGEPMVNTLGKVVTILRPYDDCVYLIKGIPAPFNVYSESMLEPIKINWRKRLK